MYFSQCLISFSQFFSVIMLMSFLVSPVILLCLAIVLITLFPIFFPFLTIFCATLIYLFSCIFLPYFLVFLHVFLSCPSLISLPFSMIPHNFLFVSYTFQGFHTVFLSHYLFIACVFRLSKPTFFPVFLPDFVSCVSPSLILSLTRYIRNHMKSK